MHYISQLAYLQDKPRLNKLQVACNAGWDQAWIHKGKKEKKKEALW